MWAWADSTRCWMLLVGVPLVPVYHHPNSALKSHALSVTNAFVCSVCCSCFMEPNLFRLPSHSITSSGLPVLWCKFVSHLVLLPDTLQGCCRWQTSWESHSGSVLAQNWSVAPTTVTLIVQMAQSTQEHTVFLSGILAPKHRLQQCVFISFIKANTSWKAKWSLLTGVAHCLL